MKNLILSAFAVLVFSPLVTAQPTPKRPRIPHSHHSAHGGLVLMFGDDHVELVKTKGGKQLTLFLSDKMRDPLKASDFVLETTIIDGDQRQILKFETNPKDASELNAAVPAKIRANVQLEIKALRQNAPRTSVTTDRAQSVEFGKIPAIKEMDHSAHH